MPLGVVGGFNFRYRQLQTGKFVLLPRQFWPTLLLVNIRRALSQENFLIFLVPAFTSPFISFVVNCYWLIRKKWPISAKKIYARKLMVSPDSFTLTCPFNFIPIWNLIMHCAMYVDLRSEVHIENMTHTGNHSQFSTKNLLISFTIYPDTVCNLHVAKTLCFIIMGSISFMF